MRLIRLLKNDIAKEAMEWVDEKIITDVQARLICNRYGVDFDKAGKGSFGYNVLIGLGYLFLGLSLITLIGANWDNIPRALRMWALILTTMSVQGVAAKQFISGNTDKAAGLFLLGNLFYGASIVLIAQIYHLGEHMPDGVFWWALGCLPVGMLIKSPWVTLQSILLSLIWFFLETNLGFYPALFPVFIIGGIYVLYTGKQSLILFLTVVGAIGTWTEWTFSALCRSGISYSFHPEHVIISTALFILAYSTSQYLGNLISVKAKDYGALLSAWCLRFGIIFLIIMSFELPWEELLSSNFNHTFPMAVITATICVSSLWVARICGKVNPVIYFILFFLLTTGAVLLSQEDNHAILFQIFFNIVLIATGIWLVINGINQGISHYFFLGVTSILITALMRYIDLIGDYIGGAILFLVFACLLLGAAKYWRNKQNEAA